MINTEFFVNQSFGKQKEIPKSNFFYPKTSQDIISNLDDDSYFFRMLEARNLHLNHEQIEAVRTTEGPVLTLAGAGSGKTSVLTARIAYLVNVKKVNPQNILLLTFTVKAAEEMKTRIAKLPGITPLDVRRLVAGTFHSVFLRYLRSNGYNQNILSNEKYKQVIIKKILKELGLKEDYEPETILSMISYEKNNLRRPKDIRQKTSLEKEFVQIYEQYEKVKEKSNYIDFDDILLETYFLLTERADLLKSLQNRFQYIEVDEFQDSCHAQYQILKMIAEPQNNFFVAGDDDQSIYGWRAASNDIILSFPKEYKGCVTVNLKTNYRSNPYIVGLGNQIIKGNKKRFEKELNSVNSHGVMPFYYRPENTFEEANVILKSIQEKVQRGERTYSEFCILFRTHSVSRSMLDQLTIHDIPFIKHGMSQPFYEQNIVKPVIDHLRLMINPYDFESFSGILPSLYLSRDECLSFAHQQLKNINKQPKFQSLLHLLLLHPTLKSFQVNKINERISLLNELKELEPRKAMKELIIGKGNYAEYLKNNKRQTFTINKEIIDEMLDELLDSSKRFTSISSYLQFVEKTISKHSEMDQLKKSPDHNAISLMSIHNAKGLEFPCVYLIGASEGIIPHSSSLKDAEDRVNLKNGQEKVLDAIEEERRLLYVAITRAKEELYITSPKNFRNKKLNVSSFLQ